MSDVIPFLLIFLPLPIVRNEAKCGTNWKVYATKRDITYHKWYKQKESGYYKNLGLPHSSTSFMKIHL